MRYPKPAKYVISAIDAEGRPVPAAYRSTCSPPNRPDEGFSSLHFPEGIRIFARNSREDGYEVTVEDLAELPDEMIPTWLLLRLVQLMPPSRRSELTELGGLAISRAEQLRTLHLAEHADETLFVATAPDEDQVLDLVFTRGNPLIYSRIGDEWVRSTGIGDFEYQCYGMVAVVKEVVPLYDERIANSQPLLLSELRELGLIGK